MTETNFAQYETQMRPIQHARPIRNAITPYYQARSMLAPFDRVEVDALLHQLPQWAKLSQEGDALANSLEHVVDLALCRETTDSKPNTAVCALITCPERTQHIAGLKRGGRAGTAGREGNVLQRHEKRLTLDVGERHVHAAGVMALTIAVECRMLERKQALKQPVREGSDVLVIILIN